MVRKVQESAYASCHEHHHQEALYEEKAGHYTFHTSLNSILRYLLERLS